MIELKGLTKRYGEKVAVDNLSFTIEKGEVVGFLGPNGAGKSTTMNMLTGYISATEGQALIDGYDILETPNEAKRRIGYLPEQPPLYLDMTVDEYLRFAFNLKKAKVEDVKAHIDEILERVGIAHVKTRLIKNLSKGYRQRVGLAQALLGNPEVLILDEPTVGLDPAQMIEIRNLIRDLGKEHTVLLSSHILHEVSEICNRIIMIAHGKIVADDSLENLSHTAAGGRLIVEAEGDETAILAALFTLPTVHGVTQIGAQRFMVEAPASVELRRAIFDRCVERGFALTQLKQEELSLEEVFLQRTQEGGNNA